MHITSKVPYNLVHTMHLFSNLIKRGGCVSCIGTKLQFIRLYKKAIQIEMSYKIEHKRELIYKFTPTTGIMMCKSYLSHTDQCTGQQSDVPDPGWVSIQHMHTSTATVLPWFQRNFSFMKIRMVIKWKLPKSDTAIIRGRAHHLLLVREVHRKNDTLKWKVYVLLYGEF